MDERGGTERERRERRRERKKEEALRVIFGLCNSEQMTER